MLIASLLVGGDQCLMEGLGAGTLIKTINNYTHIETLKPGDMICGYDAAGTYYEQKVIAVSHSTIPNYITLHVNGHVIRAAPDQKFYQPIPHEWIAAKDLTQGHVLAKGQVEFVSVDQAEVVSEEITIYALTVEGHEFCITDADIHVHNMEAIVTPLCFIGRGLASANPLGAAIGTTIIIGSLAYGAYKTYRKNKARAQALKDYTAPLIVKNDGGVAVEQPANDGTNNPQATSEAASEKDLEEKEKKKISEAAVGKVLEGAKDGEKTSSKKLTQYEKPGGYPEALKDFKSMPLSDIKKDGDVLIGTLPDGRRVNVRLGSKDGRPTLEIYNHKDKKCIKIRYGNK